MKARKRAPLNYADLSDAALADTFAMAKERTAAEERQLKALTAELVTRGKSQYCGVTHTVVRVQGEQLRFNSKAAIAEMGQGWYDGHKATTATVTWAASLNDAATAAQAKAEAVIPAAPKAEISAKPPTRRRRPAAKVAA